MKIAKIIATSAATRSHREKTVLTGSPPRYTSHSQNYTSVERIKTLIELNISSENKSNPGREVDLILVNNSIGNQKFDNYIKELNGKKISNGKIYTLTNQNIGWSFGAYNSGFLKFRDRYDYFIFTEDDTIISGDNYALDAVNEFKNNNNCGFVSYIGITKSAFNEKSSGTIHAHGGVGLTSSKILNMIVDEFGSLPYSTSDSYEEVIMEGEVKFTNYIYQMGFKLIDISEHKYFNYAYDMERNINQKIKPNLLQLLVYFFKKYVKQILFKLVNKSQYLSKVYKNFKRT